MSIALLIWKLKFPKLKRNIDLTLIIKAIEWKKSLKHRK